jgi:hypothetical protein
MVEALHHSPQVLVAQVMRVWVAPAEPSVGAQAETAPNSKSRQLLEVVAVAARELALSMAERVAIMAAVPAALVTAAVPVQTVSALSPTRLSNDR